MPETPPPSLYSIVLDELAQYSITLSDTGLARYMIDAGFVPADAYKDYTPEKQIMLDQVLLAVVSRILLTPDVTEGGMSLKWDRAGVRVYQGILQARLGIVPAGAPTVSDRSNLW